MCAVTSNTEDRKYSVLIDQQSLKSGALPIKSRIRADKIMQIEKSIVIKPFATLKDSAFDLLTKEILNVIKRA